MKIAIAGAGMTGAYLYRLLRNRGHEIDIFLGPRDEMWDNSLCLAYFKRLH